MALTRDPASRRHRPHHDQAHVVRRLPRLNLGFPSDRRSTPPRAPNGCFVGGTPSRRGSATASQAVEAAPPVKADVNQLLVRALGWGPVLAGLFHRIKSPRSRFGICYPRSSATPRVLTKHMECAPSHSIHRTRLASWLARQVVLEARLGNFPSYRKVRGSAAPEGALRLF